MRLAAEDLVSRHSSRSPHDDDERSTVPLSERDVHPAQDHDRGDADDSARQDIFTRDLLLPRDDDRHPYRSHERTYSLHTREIETLATIGAFRVVPDTDLGRSAGIRRLQEHGLIARHHIIVNSRPTTVAVLTK